MANTLRDALASRIEAVYGLTTLHAALESFRATPVPPPYSDEAKASSYAFGLIALAKFALRLPVEVLEDKLLRPKHTLITALTDTTLPLGVKPASLKTYELGVLCSVDVAVIIFGAPHSHFPLNSCSTILFLFLTARKYSHSDKLFQYCSTDIDSLVQRGAVTKSLPPISPRRPASV